MGRYELSDTDNQIFQASKMRIHRNKNLKVFHKHNHFEILLTKSNDSAKSYFITENFKLDFNSNSVVLAHPNLKHRTERNTKNTFRIIVCFKREFIEPIAQFLDIDIDALFSKYVLNYTNEQISDIMSIANKIVDEYKSNNDCLKNKDIKLLTAMLLYKLTKYESEAEFSFAKEDLMSEIVAFLQYNYNSHITLEYLAEKFGINKYELCKRSKKHFGFTVIELLTNIRINNARKLLEETTLTIVDIAERVGFNSSSYFSKNFKAHTGYSPQEYREKMRKPDHNHPFA